MAKRFHWMIFKDEDNRIQEHRLVKYFDDNPDKKPTYLPPDHRYRTDYLAKHLLKKGWVSVETDDNRVIHINPDKGGDITYAQGYISKMIYADFGDAPNDDPGELQTFAAHVRRGQPKFREKLLRAYGDRCSISGHGPKEVLEAVHIAPHAKTGINKLDITTSLTISKTLMSWSYRRFDNGLAPGTAVGMRNALPATRYLEKGVSYKLR